MNTAYQKCMITLHQRSANGGARATCGARRVLRWRAKFNTKKKKKKKRRK